jgi:hypothetical protein
MTTRVAAVFSVIALPVLAASAGGFAAWTSPRHVSAPGTVSAARIGIDARSNATFGWLRRDSRGVRVQVRRRSAGGRLGPIVDLSDPGSVAGDLRLVVAPNGRAVAAWSERQPHGPAVLRARAVSAEGARGPLVTITDAALRFSGPQVVIDASGDALLTWTQLAGKAIAVMARRWPAAGELGPATDVSTTTPSSSGDPPGVAIDADGDALFAWLAQDAGVQRVLVRAWPRGQAPGTIGVVSKPVEYIESPHIVLAPDGSGIIAWGAQPHGSGGVKFTARRRSATGTLGRIVDLGVGHFHPGLALGADGTAYYTGSYDIDPDGEVRAGTLSTDGVVVAMEASVTNDHARVQIAALPGGGALLVWSGERARGVRARTLSRAGEIGAQTRVSPPGRWTAQPALVIAAGGEAQVAWVTGKGHAKTVESAVGSEFARRDGRNQPRGRAA